MQATGIEIRRTDERQAAVALGVAAGLDERGPADEHVSAVWGAYDGDVLVGTVALAVVDGLAVVSWLAVDEGYRGRGLGRRLVGELEAEVRRRGGSEVWAAARAPAFFESLGYREAASGQERERLLADCLDCDQFETSCRPKVVVRRWSPRPRSR